MKLNMKILAAGCMIAMLAAPVTSYAEPVLISARTGVPVVSVSESAYANVAISRVTNYVNVRAEANTTSAVVGKIYNNSAAAILATVNGEGGTWYQIQSGTVTGYIKAQYFVTGAEAEKLAKEIGTVFVKINTATLRLREKASTDSAVLTLLSQDAEYMELGEEGDFVKIEIDQSMSGYVHKDYITERVEFNCAVSTEEEKQQAEEAARLKKEAEEAMAALNQVKENVSQILPETSDTSQTAGTENIGTIPANPNGATGENATAAAPNSNGATETTENTQTQTDGNTGGPGKMTAEQMAAGPGALTQETKASADANAQVTEATRTAIVAYAKQFLGNPYVYGGTSLTDGADCSGFTMKIYEHFGISTGRTSRDQADQGKTIAIDAVLPGDLLFYASGDYINHVGMYIGGGQIIHAATSKSGITISAANYRTPYKAVTFLE